MSRKFLNKLEKNIGMKKLKTEIRVINLFVVFVFVIILYNFYLNHDEKMISYGFAVMAGAMFILAFFLSIQVKLRVKLNSLNIDYRKMVVKPVVEEYFEGGSFSRSGVMTEREILSTLMFSDELSYKYASQNEIKGEYDDVPFKSYDMTQVSSETSVKLFGRIFEFDMDTVNVNPVVFTSAAAGVISLSNQRVSLLGRTTGFIDKNFRTYAFDEDEAMRLIDAVSDKLQRILDMGLSRVIKLCFYSGKVYVFYATDGYTFKEKLTRKDKVPKEVYEVIDQLKVIKNLIETLHRA